MGYHYRVAGFGDVPVGCTAVPYVDKAGRSGTGNLCANSSGTCGDPSALQYALQYLGYGPIDVDGVIGPQTIAALRNYAAVNNIPYAGGSPGPELCAPILAQYSGESAPVMPAAPAAQPKLSVTSMPTTKTVGARQISVPRSSSFAPTTANAGAVSNAGCGPGTVWNGSSCVSAAPSSTIDKVEQWWTSTPTWQKYAIVGGGVAAVGAGAYFLFLRKPKALPNRRRRRRRR